jgi:hypothetical protein
VGLANGDLRTFILADATIAGLVEDRIFAVRRQQGSALPSLVITLISTDPKTTFAGYAGMRFRRFQVDIYADEESGDDLDTLGQALFELLEGIPGTMGTTKVPRAHLASETDMDEGQAQVLRRMQDWLIFEEG